MGSWSVYCGISQISITAGHSCVLLPLKKDMYADYVSQFVPATLPIFGEYDDYGGLENIVCDENTAYIEKSFDCTIDEFCRFFTRGCIRTDEDDFPKKLLDNEILASWQFMFIDRNVFDFMTTYVPVGYCGRGHHNMGNVGLLNYLGFEYKGTGTDSRYKHIWQFNGKRFLSDGTWMCLETDNTGIYDMESLEDIVTIPDDKQWLKDKAWWHLWKLVDTNTREEMLRRGIGLSRHEVFDRRVALDDIAFREKFNDVFKYDPPKPDAFKEFTFGYFENLEAFGDRLAGMVSLSTNLHPMSCRFRPYELYSTPQCGEFETHQIFLEKFAEINRQYLNELE